MIFNRHLDIQCSGWTLSDSDALVTLVGSDLVALKSATRALTELRASIPVDKARTSEYRTRNEA